MTWTYYAPKVPGMAYESRPFSEKAVTQDALRKRTETVGRRELAVMLRARGSASGTLFMLHTREFNADRMAARRLVQRGLLTDPNVVGNSLIGWSYVYGLTRRGAETWLRVRSE